MKIHTWKDSNGRFHWQECTEDQPSTHTVTTIREADSLMVQLAIEAGSYLPSV